MPPRIGRKLQNVFAFHFGQRPHGLAICFPRRVGNRRRGRFPAGRSSFAGPRTENGPAAPGRERPHSRPAPRLPPAASHRRRSAPAAPREHSCGDTRSVIRSSPRCPIRYTPNCGMPLLEYRPAIRSNTPPSGDMLAMRPPCSANIMPSFSLVASSTINRGKTGSGCSASSAARLPASCRASASPFLGRQLFQLPQPRFGLPPVGLFPGHRRPRGFDQLGFQLAQRPHRVGEDGRLAVARFQQHGHEQVDRLAPAGARFHHHAPGNRRGANRQRQQRRPSPPAFAWRAIRLPPIAAARRAKRLSETRAGPTRRKIRFRATAAPPPASNRAPLRPAASIPLSCRRPQSNRLRPPWLAGRAIRRSAPIPRCLEATGRLAGRGFGPVRRCRAARLPAGRAEMPHARPSTSPPRRRCTSPTRRCGPSCRRPFPLRRRTRAASARPTIPAADRGPRAPL